MFVLLVCALLLDYLTRYGRPVNAVWFIDLYAR